MYQTKVMSSPVKVRAQTEPGKYEGDKPTTEKTAAGKKGRRRVRKITVSSTAEGKNG